MTGKKFNSSRIAPNNSEYAGSLIDSLNVHSTQRQGFREWAFLF